MSVAKPCRRADVLVAADVVGVLGSPGVVEAVGVAVGRDDHVADGDAGGLGLQLGDGQAGVGRADLVKPSAAGMAERTSDRAAAMSAVASNLSSDCLAAAADMVWMTPS